MNTRTSGWMATAFHRFETIMFRMIAMLTTMGGLAVLGTAFGTNEALAQGTIAGTVSDADNKPLANVSVGVKPVGYKTRSSVSGMFRFENLAKGRYTVVLLMQGKQTLEQEATVEDGQTTTLTVQLLEKATKFSDVTVYGAVKRAEKITESPAAISTALPQDLERASRHGTLARTLEGFTGVDIMQSGSTDFIVNARGFNNGLNRRVLVLQDGRDAAMPLLGAQEWNSFNYPVDDYARIEFVRGPAAALYGANAFNGVLNMTTYAPKEVLGTRVSLLGGDYQTFRVDVRNAGILSDKISYKVSAGRSQTRNLATRRDSVQFLEYPGLVLERRVLSDADRNTFNTYGALRIDYDATETERATLEAGYSRSGNEIYVFGLGRTFVPDVERPYIRFAYNAAEWNIHAHYMTRFVPDTMRLMAVAAAPVRGPNGDLRSGNALLDDSRDALVDVQRTFNPAPNLNLIAGASVQMQYVNTLITTTDRNVTAFFSGLYGQAEWKISSEWKAVASARFDASNIHLLQFSPRLALVFAPVAEHQFRITAGRSFQRANYQELYRSTPAPPPANFAALEMRLLDSLAVWSGNGSGSGARPAIDLGVRSIAPRALGNASLDVEKNIGLELGYKGVFSETVFLTVDAYYNRVNDLITSFLPGINPAYPRWNPQLPANLAQYQNRLNGAIDGILGLNATGLTLWNGAPAFVQSNANIGNVNQFGVEVGVNYYVTSKLLASGNLSLYSFSIGQNNTPQPILPNTSPFRGTLSLSYAEPNLFDVSAQLRYVEGFAWLAGVYTGFVPSYAVVNLNAGVTITQNVRAGFSIQNLLDRKHFEIFGGTIMPRLASVKVDVTF
jgi:outer membrane receptor for ferrienterochelin and colicins